MSTASSYASTGGDASAESSSVRIFGSLIFIENYYGCLSILIIVFIVLLLEYIFLTIQKLSEDTPFADIIVGIKNEMMIGMYIIN